MESLIRGITSIFQGVSLRNHLQTLLEAQVEPLLLNPLGRAFDVCAQQLLSVPCNAGAIEPTAPEDCKDIQQAPFYKIISHQADQGANDFVTPWLKAP